MSVFDPKLFAAQTFTEANSTEYVPHPVGDYLGMVESYEIKTWQKKDDPSKQGLKFEAKISTEDPAVAEATGRAKTITTYEAMLDLTEDGRLDFGKGMNVRLGQFRAAIGCNEPGEPWTFDQFPGRMLRYRVKHRPYEGRVIAEISEVTKP